MPSYPWTNLTNSAPWTARDGAARLTSQTLGCMIMAGGILNQTMNDPHYVETSAPQNG